ESLFGDAARIRQQRIVYGAALRVCRSGRSVSGDDPKLAKAQEGATLSEAPDEERARRIADASASRPRGFAFAPGAVADRGRNGGPVEDLPRQAQEALKKQRAIVRAEPRIFAELDALHLRPERRPLPVELRAAKVRLEARKGGDGRMGGAFHHSGRDEI